MNRWIKRSLIRVAVTVAVGASTLGIAAFYGDSKMQRTVTLPEAVQKRLPASLGATIQR